MEKRLLSLRFQAFVWLAIIVLPFLLFSIYPFLVLVINSLGTGEGVPPGGVFSKIGFFFSNFTLQNYLKIFNPRYSNRLTNTFVFSLLNTGVSLIIGVPLAIYLYKRRFFASNVLRNLLLIPYMTPNYILVLAVLTITGKNGLINLVIRNITGNAEFILPMKIMFTYHGVILVLIFHGIPMVTFIVSAVLTSIDKSYEEAAISLGASKFTSIMRIVLPLSLPGIVAAGSIIFATTMRNYVVVSLIGGIGFSNLAVEVFNQYFGYTATEFASALAVFLSLMTMAIMYAYFLIYKRRLG